MSNGLARVLILVVLRGVKLRVGLGRGVRYYKELKIRVRVGLRGRVRVRVWVKVGVGVGGGVGLGVGLGLGVGVSMTADIDWLAGSRLASELEANQSPRPSCPPQPCSDEAHFMHNASR